MKMNDEKRVSDMSECPSEHEMVIRIDEDVVPPADTIRNMRDKLSEALNYVCSEMRSALGRAGVYFQGYDKEGNELEPEWICSPIKLIGHCRNREGGNWAKVLRWHDPDGVEKTWIMPASLLAGDPMQILAPLLAGGFKIAHRKKGKVIEYINSLDSDKRIIGVNKMGWAAPSEYVMANQVISADTESKVYMFTGDYQSRKYHSKGTLEEWKQNVAALCVGNNRLMFAVCIAFAGVILEPGGFQGGGFHYLGSSSIGKSMSMRLACSVMGPFDDVKISWRTTDNALESLAAMHNDKTMMLDEIGEVDGKRVGEIAYMLANGSGKARANKEGIAKPQLNWNMIFLSNGEIALLIHMAESGKMQRAGQEIRMVSIPADAGFGMGIFQDLHGEASGMHFANKIERATDQYNGTAFAPFVEYVAKNWSYVECISKAKVDNFVDKVVPKGADPQVSRVAKRFGIVALAGELATKAGITGWKVGDARDAAVACFHAWLQQREGIGSQEDADILRRLVSTISNEPTRFEPLGGEVRAINRIGFVDNNNYYITTEGFKELMKGYDYKHASVVLAEKQLIKHPIGKGLPRHELNELGRQRCYVISKEDLLELDYK